MRYLVGFCLGCLGLAFSLQAQLRLGPDMAGEPPWATELLNQSLRDNDGANTWLLPEALEDPQWKALEDRAEPWAKVSDEEAIKLLRAALAKTPEDLTLRRTLSDRLWTHYIVTGDEAEAREAVMGWRQWSQAVNAPPARVAWLTRHLAFEELWEEAIPTLMEWFKRSSLQELPQIHASASLFRDMQPELDAAMNRLRFAWKGDQLTVAAYGAKDAGSWTTVKRTLAAQRYGNPSSPELTWLRLTATATEKDPLTLLQMGRQVVDENAPPSIQILLADAVVEKLGQQRAPFLQHAQAYLDKGKSYSHAFDTLLLANCALKDDNQPLVTALLGEPGRPKVSGNLPGATGVKFLNLQRTLVPFNERAFREALNSIPQDQRPFAADYCFEQYRRGKVGEEVLLQFLEIWRRDPAPPSAAASGTQGLWLLTLHRPKEAADTFLQGLKQAVLLEERLPLLYGLAVARDQMDDSKGVQEVLSGKTEGKAGPLVRALFALRRVDQNSRKDAARLWSLAWRFAEIQNRETELRHAAQLLHLNQPAAEDYFYHRYAEEAVPDLPGGNDQLLREWPRYADHFRRNSINYLVDTRFEEFEPFVKGLTATRVRTGIAIEFKVNLGRGMLVQLKKTPAMIECAHQLLWSAYDDARELEMERVKTQAGSAEPGTLESGLRRHHYREWVTENYGWRLVPKDRNPWILPTAEEWETSFHDLSPASFLQTLRRDALSGAAEVGPRTEFVEALQAKLDAEKASGEERVLAWLNAGFKNEAMTAVETELNSGHANVDRLLKLMERASLNDAETKVQSFKRNAATWLENHPDQWPAGRTLEIPLLIKAWRPEVRNGVQPQPSTVIFSKAPTGSGPAATLPMDTLIRQLSETNSPRPLLSVLKSRLAQHDPKDNQFSLSSASTLSSAMVSWIFGSGKGLLPSSNSDMDLEVVAQALALCAPLFENAPDPVRAKQLAPPSSSSSPTRTPEPPSALLTEDFMPKPDDILPGTRFLPPDFLSLAARQENAVPTLFPSYVGAFGHVARYQRLVRWLDAQAQAHAAPEDVPFRLLSLQLRWTGGERQQAADLAKSWFEFSADASLRYVAAYLLEQIGRNLEGARLLAVLQRSRELPLSQVRKEMNVCLRDMTTRELTTFLDECEARDAMETQLLATQGFGIRQEQKPPLKKWTYLSAMGTTFGFASNPLPNNLAPSLMARDRRMQELLGASAEDARLLLRTELIKMATGARTASLTLLLADSERSSPLLLQHWIRLLDERALLEYASTLFMDGTKFVARHTADGEKPHYKALTVFDSPASGLFFNLLASLEQPHLPYRWKTLPVQSTVAFPRWLQVTRRDEEGAAVFRVEASVDGRQWSEVTTLKWKDAPARLGFGVANFSAKPLAYSGWSLNAPSKPLWYCIAATEKGKTPDFQKQNSEFPPDGELMDVEGGGASELGDSFYGACAYVKGPATLKVKLDLNDAQTRGGVFVQTDWFPGAPRLLVSLDSAGHVEVTHRLARLDGVELWQRLLPTAKSTTREGMTRLVGGLEMLCRAGKGKEAYEAVQKAIEHDFAKWMTPGIAIPLAQFFAESGHAAELADKIQSLVAAQPENANVRVVLCTALRELSSALPSSSDEDKARLSRVQVLLAQPPEEGARRIAVSADAGVRFAPASVIPPLDGAPLRSAAEALAYLERRATAPYHPTNFPEFAFRAPGGLEFDIAAYALALRDKPEAARALELYPLPGPEKYMLNGTSRPSDFVAVRLALGDKEAIRRLPEFFDRCAKMRGQDVAARFRHACASTLLAAGLKDEAAPLLAQLLKDASSAWPTVYSESYAGLLTCAAHAADEAQRKAALDQSMTVVRQCAAAVSLDPQLRQAVRYQAIPLFKENHRDQEASDLEALLQTDHP